MVERVLNPQRIVIGLNRRELSEIELNVSDPPPPLLAAQGDFDKDSLTGTDDTQAIQAAFDYAKNQGIKRIVFDGDKKYKISNRILTNQNNVEVDFRGATLYWYNLTNIVNQFPDIRESWVGAIEFSGSRIESTKTKLNNYQTITEAQSTQYETAQTRMGRLTVTDASQYGKGDNVYIYAPTQPQGDYVIASPVIQTAAKVIKIDSTNNYIYTDFYSPYDWYWGNYNFDDIASDCHVVKLDAVKNTKVLNMDFEDLNPHIQLDFNEPPATDSQLQVSGIANKYGDGFVVENYKAIGTHFGAVETYGSRNISFKNIESKYAKYNGPGKGYGTHISHSMNISIENFHCQDVRHTIDFSSSQFATVTNASGQGLEQFSFTLHGQGEHSITFINCHGTSKIGHGVLYFADLNANVTYINCDISEQRFSWVDNLSFENSTVGINGSAYHQGNYEMHLGRVSFKDCKVTIPNFRHFIGDNRGAEAYKTKLSFERCSFKGIISDEIDTNSIKFDTINKLTFRDCDEIDLSDIPSRFNFNDIGSLNIHENNMTNTYLEWNNDSGEIYYNDVFIEKNNFLIDDNSTYLTQTFRNKPFLWDRPNTVGKFVFRDNTIELGSDLYELEILGIPSSSAEWSGSRIDFKNEDTRYILNGVANVSIPTREYTDILVTVLRAKFTTNGTGVFNFSGGFNISQTDIVDSIPTHSWQNPPNTMNKPRTGAYCYNVDQGLGNNKGWVYSGTQWLSDINTAENRTLDDGTSETFVITNSASKRGLFFVNVSYTSATYAQFISNGTGQGFTVINKSSNVNFDSVIAGALNIEMDNGNIKVTNNLGSSRQVAISCIGF